MDGYFYINSNSNDKVEVFNKDDYIQLLKAQIRILKADNNRLIKMLEKRDNK